MTEKRLSDLVTSHYSHYKISERNLVTKSLVTKKVLEHSSTKRNKRCYSGAQARSKADYLARKLRNPSRIGFYLKCAWNLTDEYLDRLLSISLNKKDPARYFSAAASREIRANL